MTSILTNNHYPVGSVCQVTTGWAQQSNTTINAGDTSAITNYSLTFTPKFPNSLCIYETAVASRNSASAGYNRFFAYDTANAVYIDGPGSYIAMSSWNDSDYNYFETPIRVTFTPLHTNAMTIKLYAYAITGNAEFNWSASDYRLMSVTEIVQ